MEASMKLVGGSAYSPKTETAKKRSAPIPLVMLALVASFLVLHQLHEGPAPVAAEMVHADASPDVARSQSYAEVLVNVDGGGRDPAVEAHEALDPVGAGHDVPR